jgi:AcrR family transcriptional regulator
MSVSPRKPHVKVRGYDASKRRAAARDRRDRILERARELFLRDGYAATTVAAVAGAADVSTETIYKVFGGKSGLVRAMHARALEGSGPTPAEERSDVLRQTASARDIVAGWGELTTEVSPQVAPLMVLVREAAASDPEMFAAWTALDDARHARMLSNAQVLADRGFLRAGVTTDQAADVMFALTSAEIYEMLVLRRGWSVEQYGAYVREHLTHALLE